MGFSKKAFFVLDKNIKKANYANKVLDNTHERVREFDLIPRPSEKEKAKICWRKAKGSCSVFLSGRINEPVCKYCPGVNSINRMSNSLSQNRKNEVESDQEKEWFRRYAKQYPDSYPKDDE